MSLEVYYTSEYCNSTSHFFFKLLDLAEGVETWIFLPPAIIYWDRFLSLVLSIIPSRYRIKKGFPRTSLAGIVLCYQYMKRIESNYNQNQENCHY